MIRENPHRADIQRCKNLRADTVFTLFAVQADRRYQSLLALRRMPHTQQVYPFGESLHYTDARRDVPPERIQREVADFLQHEGFNDVKVDVAAPTVEDTFMARMGAPA